jgi:hypothetical protein
MLGVSFYLIHCGHSYFCISPGRFFAVNEVKAFLAHIVVTYDIKFEEGKQAPDGLYIGAIRIPRKANAMFRKRPKPFKQNVIYGSSSSCISQ